MRTLNLQRIVGTIDAVRADMDSLNQRLWVTPNKDCGCFLWHAVRLYGTAEERASFTWDMRRGSQIAGKVLGLSDARAAKVSRATNTMSDVEDLLDDYITQDAAAAVWR